MPLCGTDPFVERHESAQAKAERLFNEELERRGWSIGELAQRKKGDRQKVKIALHLRQQTTMTWAWIAQRLEMGVGAYAANCARALREGE